MQAVRGVALLLLTPKVQTERRASQLNHLALSLSLASVFVDTVKCAFLTPNLHHRDHSPVAVTEEEGN